MLSVCYNCFSPLGLFAKLRKVTIGLVISVCSHGTRTVHARYTHGTRTIHARYTHGTHTAHERYTHGKRTIHTRHTHGRQTIYARHTHGTTLLLLNGFSLYLLSDYYFFRTAVDKIQVPFRSEGYVTWKLKYTYDILIGAIPLCFEII